MSVELASDNPSFETLSRKEFWQQHLSRCTASSLSKMDYCRTHQLAYHQMMYWQKRLQPLVPASPKRDRSQNSKLLPVVVGATSASSDSLSIVLPNGLKISGITDQTVTWVKPLLLQL